MPGINFVYKLMWNVSPETVIGGALLEVEPFRAEDLRYPPVSSLSSTVGGEIHLPNLAIHECSRGLSPHMRCHHDSCQQQVGTRRTI
jgi:hypothetical protein